MITQQDIYEEVEFLQTRLPEKWAVKELEKWERIQSTFDRVQELESELYFNTELVRKQNEILSYIEKVFDSLGFLGDSSLLFSQNPKPLSGFYMLALMQLLPKDHDFRNTLIHYSNGILDRQNETDFQAYIERQSRKDPYPNAYKPS